MSVLASVVGLLGLLFVLVAIVGLVSPRWLKNKRTGEVPKRSELLLGGVVAGVAAFLISSFLRPDPPSQDVAQGNTPTQSVVAAPVDGSVEHAPTASLSAQETHSERFTAASGEAFAAAQQHIRQLDQALEGFEAVLRHGDLKDRGEQSSRLNELVERGRRLFGDSVFEPLGYCYTAGTQARAFWHEHMAAQRSGAEVVQGSLQGALENYKKHRDECLRTANPATPVKPHNECLITYGVNPETKTVEALPRPDHCQTPTEES
ncbi:hypothetical protein GHU20_13485 [Pseudomonas aeruginosa]|nr:hypothetical protein [Pseudomonas aeruginosa]